MDIENEIRLLKEAQDNLAMVAKSLEERKAYGALEMTPVLASSIGLVEVALIFLGGVKKIIDEGGEERLIDFEFNKKEERH